MPEGPTEDENPVEHGVTMWSMSTQLMLAHVMPRSRNHYFAMLTAH